MTLLEREPLEEIKNQIEQIAKSHNIRVGLAAIDLNSGEEIMLNSDVKFPMASTYKVPIAAYALHLADIGELSLDDMFPVYQMDYVTSSPLAEAFPHAGVEISLLNLIEPTIIYSDNTATDVLLRAVGGPEAVTTWLRSLGIEDMNVNRLTADIIREYVRMPKPEDPTISPADYFNSMDIDNNPPSQAENDANYKVFLDDPRDQATPRAMAILLYKIFQDQVVSSEKAALLKSIMSRCKTGENRLPGDMPDAALPVAHKTGTIGASINDVGLLKLTGQKNDLITVIFTQGKASWAPEDWLPAEKNIAEIARALHDFFSRV